MSDWSWIPLDRIVTGDKLTSLLNERMPSLIGVLKTKQSGTGVYNAFDYSVRANGLVDDAGGLNKWASALATKANGTTSAKGVMNGGVFLTASTINFSEPRLLSIDAEGSVLKPNFDDACVDLHSGYNPASAGQNIYCVHWQGGRFVNTAGTKTASVGMRVYAATDFLLDGTAYFQSFLSAIDISGQDSYYLRTFRTSLCDYGVRLLDVFGSASAGQTLACVVEDAHINLTGTAVAGYYLVGTFSNFEVRGGNTNGHGTLASFYAESGGGSGVLNPTSISIKNHHFEQGVSTSRYIWLKQTNSKSFFNVVIDNCSFAVGATGGDDAVRGALKFEAVKGLSIRNCQFPITNTSSGCAIYLDANCTNIKIDRETFFNVGTIVAWQASTAYVLNTLAAPSTYGELVFKCTTAGTSNTTEPTWPTTVGGTVTDGTAVWTAQCAPIIYKCARSEITLEPTTVSLGHQGLTGYNTGKTFSGAASGQTLNMRALLGTKFPGKLMPPKGFRLYVTAKDSKSTTDAPTDCGVRFAVDSTTYNAGGTDRKRTGIQLAGAADSQERYAFVEVECDANGNIYMQTIPSSTGTLTVWIVGVEALQ